MIYPFNSPLPPHSGPSHRSHPVSLQRMSDTCDIHTKYERIFFFNDTATTEIYTLSLHDALPIFRNIPLTSEAQAVLKSLCAGRTAGFIFLTPDGGVLDRKSTRLNSSHANISYAVFCLKKK